MWGLLRTEEFTKFLPPAKRACFLIPRQNTSGTLHLDRTGLCTSRTGDKGQIYAVAPDGKSELFYASDEAHIRVIAFDGKGSVIVGTEPSGRVLRPRRKQKAAERAEGFVLYETPKREVTALAVGPDGSIFAAAIGERQHNAAVNLGRDERHNAPPWSRQAET